MKKNLLLYSGLFAILCIMPEATMAQRKVDLGEAEFSYAGFFVRANVGFGAGSAEWIDLGKNEGAGISLAGRAGYRFTKGIGLHGVVSSGIYTNSTSNDWDPVEKLNFTNIGGGPTFYFGKGYSYLILEVVYTKISIDDGFDAWTTSGGVGGTLATGYDFNVAKNFGIGLCAFVHVGSMKDFDDYYDVINLFYGVEISFRVGK